MWFHLLLSIPNKDGEWQWEEGDHFDQCLFNS